MKALVHRVYGSPDVLRLEDLAQPVPGDDDVLVKVRAASVNSWDWDNLTGATLLSRMLSGFSAPRRQILGADIAGRVEAVGKNVTRLQPGNDVFGDLCQSGWGGFAEYVCAHERALALKPAAMTFEQAASLPQAGVMALQGVRDYGELAPGSTVLINGAAGGVGTFAIQMAKLYGAEVTGVDSTRKLDTMRSLGADHVVDYTQEDFADRGQRFDVILDVTAERSMSDYRRALASGGRYIMIGGTTVRIVQLLLFSAWLSLARSKQRMALLAHQPNKDLSFLAELVVSGKITPAIDRCYPLSQAPMALQRLGEGNVLGKLIITM